MNKIIISLLSLSALLSSHTVSAQCPNTTGNYEYSISNDAKSIVIKARNTTATLRSSYVDPAINGNFVGLVFGVKWSANSEIRLGGIASEQPFNILASGGVLEKNGYNFQSYGDVAESLPILSKEWMSGEWHVIATIPYSGSLANGSTIELTECGFDETTNPYFSQMDKQGHYGQYAPNIVRNASAGANLAIANAVIVYPNPTNNELFVDVSSATLTRATLKVMDMTGKTIKTIESDLTEGVNKISLQVGELSNGMYMLKVSDGKALNYAQTFNKQ